MEELKLVRPSMEHKRQYEEMMDEWESFGGRLNPMVTAKGRKL